MAEAAAESLCNLGCSQVQLQHHGLASSKRFQRLGERRFTSDPGMRLLCWVKDQPPPEWRGVCSAVPRRMRCKARKVGKAFRGSRLQSPPLATPSGGQPLATQEHPSVPVAAAPPALAAGFRRQKARLQARLQQPGGTAPSQPAPSQPIKVKAMPPERKPPVPNQAPLGLPTARQPVPIVRLKAMPQERKPPVPSQAPPGLPVARRPMPSQPVRLKAMPPTPKPPVPSQAPPGLPMERQPMPSQPVKLKAMPPAPKPPVPSQPAPGLPTASQVVPGVARRPKPAPRGRPGDAGLAQSSRGCNRTRCRSRSRSRSKNRWRFNNGQKQGPPPHPARQMPLAAAVPPPIPNAIRCVFPVIVQRARMACVALHPHEENDLQAWLADVHREDVATSKRLQEEQLRGQDELPSLWLAMPQDMRPPAPARGYIAAAFRGGFQRDLTTRESQIAYVFKDIFQKHQGEVVAVSSEWRSIGATIPAELVSGQFLVPAGRHNPPPALGGVLARSVDGPAVGDRVSSLAALDSNNPNACWVRVAEVTTWIRLVAWLGREFTAEALHAFFRSCELITTKKTSQTGAGAQLRTTEKWRAKAAATKCVGKYGV